MTRAIKAWAWMNKGKFVSKRSELLYVRLKRPTGFCLCKSYEPVEIRPIRPKPKGRKKL